MEHQKIINLLGSASDIKTIPKINTKNWVVVNNQSSGTFNTNIQIWFNTCMLQSELCDFSNAYIIIKRKITVDRAANRKSFNPLEDF